MGACTKEPHFCIVTELLPGGSISYPLSSPPPLLSSLSSPLSSSLPSSPLLSLITVEIYDVLHTRRARFDLKLALYFAKQTALALNYLHMSTPQIVHRDLKTGERKKRGEERRERGRGGRVGREKRGRGERGEGRGGRGASFFFLLFTNLFLAENLLLDNHLNVKVIFPPSSPHHLLILFFPLFIIIFLKKD